MGFLSFFYVNKIQMKTGKKITTFLKENKIKLEESTQFHANIEYDFKIKQVSVGFEGANWQNTIFSG